MISLKEILEASVIDIDGTIKDGDEFVDVLTELAEARKLKSIFSPDKKDKCSIMFKCPTLLSRCLDLKVKHKIASKKLGTPTSLMLCYEYNSKDNIYNITIRVHNERAYCTCLYATSRWEYSNKAKSAEIANKIFEYMLKSENHFKTLLSVFDSNHLSYKSSYSVYEFFEAPIFSSKLLLSSLQKL